MKTNCLHTYRSDIGLLSDLPKKAAPDTFTINTNTPFSPPENKFIISRYLTGEILSCYGNDTWDLTPYSSAGDTSSARIHFSSFSQHSLEDIKWLMFILLFIADSGRCTGLSVSTIKSYFKVMRPLAEYLDVNDINLKQLYSNEEHLIKFVKNINSRYLLHSFCAVTSHIQAIGCNITTIKTINNIKNDHINKKLSQLGKNEQHPVIPQRILANLINELTIYIDKINRRIDDLHGFLIDTLSNDIFARSRSMQYKIGCRATQYAPTFIDASKLFNLEELFRQFNVTNLLSLTLFITRTQHACKVLLHIYSGMRNSEALCLKTNCLKMETNDHSDIYRIHGQTSKLIGQNKSVSWITSSDIVPSYTVANTLAKIIGSHNDIHISKIPLFISAGHLNFMHKKTHETSRILTNKFSLKNQEIYNLLDNSSFMITNTDLNQLENIDPFRSWNTEKKFKTGSIWRFTTHQFRRSLAFYISQSALVSLPSLKRQMKHLSREMTIYYCQSKALDNLYDNRDHIARMIRKHKPEADTIAYISDIIFSKEPLHGAHGHFVDQHLKKSLNTHSNMVILQDSREKLIKRFKNGEISYKTTPLGACTTVEPCDKKATREIAACISCDKAVIKLSKLNRVINRQQIFVDELKRIDIESIEYRNELAELTALHAFKRSITKKDSKL